MIETHYPRGAVAPTEILAAAGPADQAVAAARTVCWVAEVGEPERSPDGRWVRIAAVLAHTPDSDAALDTVDLAVAVPPATPWPRSPAPAGRDAR